jgi:hypothetical protein
MSLEAMMTFEGMLIIGLVVAAAGIGIAQVFRNADSPFLITITGSRLELVVFGVLIWTSAIALGFASLLIVSALTSGLIGLAVFFGVEAVALDICAHRTRYVRVSSPAVQHARVRLTPPHHS